MNASRPRRAWTVRVAATAGVALLALTGAAAWAADPVTSSQPLPGADARILIERATASVQADPGDTEALLTLGLAWYQHARETADPSDYARAQEAFDRILAIEPDDVEAIIGSGTIALARHQFQEALPLAEAAVAGAPTSSRAWGILGDSLVELGRYDDAADAIQNMVDLRPDLSSYSRVAYQRELRGDLPGAIRAMERAVIAGGPSTENTGYVRVLLGNLWFLAGDLDKAEASYGAALARSPGFVNGLAGLARVAAARGDLDRAIDLYQQAVDRVPLPATIIALGETQEADGRADAAATTYRFVRDIEALFAANGVNTDLDIALFEADHGDVATALGHAQEAYAQAPTVRAADALGWVLYRNDRADDARPFAEESLRLGSVEPGYLFHAGTIAAAQGDATAAREWLTASLASNPTWSPLRAPIARQALEGLP